MQKIYSTYTGLLWWIPSLSDGMLDFRSKTSQSGHLSESMTQGGKEMMVGRWQGILGRLDIRASIREALDQTYLKDS